MQNEPQLSAEIEQQFDKEFGYLSVAIDYYVENAYPLRKESGMKHLRDIKHFLATALEEQRAEYVERVGKLYQPKINRDLDGYRPEDAYDKAIDDVLAILNGKDTNEE